MSIYNENYYKINNRYNKHNYKEIEKNNSLINTFEANNCLNKLNNRNLRLNREKIINKRINRSQDDINLIKIQMNIDLLNAKMNQINKAFLKKAKPNINNIKPLKRRNNSMIIDEKNLNIRKYDFDIGDNIYKISKNNINNNDEYMMLNKENYDLNYDINLYYNNYVKNKSKINKLIDHKYNHNNIYSEYIPSNSYKNINLIKNKNILNANYFKNNFYIENEYFTINKSNIHNNNLIKNEDKNNKIQDTKYYGLYDKYFLDTMANNKNSTQNDNNTYISILSKEKEEEIIKKGKESNNKEIKEDNEKISLDKNEEIKLENNIEVEQDKNELIDFEKKTEINQEKNEEINNKEEKSKINIKEEKIINNNNDNKNNCQENLIELNDNKTNSNENNLFILSKNTSLNKIVNEINKEDKELLADKKKKKSSSLVKRLINRNYNEFRKEKQKINIINKNDLNYHIKRKEKQNNQNNKRSNKGTPVKPKKSKEKIKINKIQFNINNDEMKKKKKLSIHEEDNISIEYNQKDEITNLSIFGFFGEQKEFKPRNINVILEKLKRGKISPILLNRDCKDNLIKLPEKSEETEPVKKFHLNKKTLDKLMASNKEKLLLNEYNLKKYNHTFQKIQKNKINKKKRICKKFKNNPQQFFTEDLCNLVVKSFDIDENEDNKENNNIQINGEKNDDNYIQENNFANYENEKEINEEPFNSLQKIIEESDEDIKVD